MVQEGLTSTGEFYCSVIVASEVVEYSESVNKRPSRFTTPHALEGSSTNIDVFLEKIFVRLGGGGVWALFVSYLQKKISNSIYGRALFEHVVYDLHKVKVNLVSIAMARLCDRGNINLGVW